MPSTVNRMLVLLLLLLSVGFAVSNKGECSSYNICQDCVEDPFCSWIESRLSCQLTSNPFPPNEERTRSCSTPVEPTHPPSFFSLPCAQESVHNAEDVFCQCPHQGLEGSKCEVCTSNAACRGQNEICASNLKNVHSDERHLSCQCVSPFCKSIGFYKEGLVNVNISFNALGVPVTAQIDLLKNIALRPFVSPFLLRAALSSCVSYEIPCANACGESEPCRADQVLDPHAQCNVWMCSKSESFCPSPESGGIFAGDCDLIGKLIAPPFHFVCVKKGNSQDLLCGFDTLLLPQGMITLECTSGTCTSVPQKDADDDDEDEMGPFSRFSLNTLILCLPLGYTVLLALLVWHRDRNTRSVYRLSTSVFSTIPNEDEEGLQERNRASPDLMFSNLNFSVGNRNILQSLSGSVPSGELCAILGPSGSGKTSLIDILAGRKVNFSSGVVYLNSRPTSTQELKERVGFVTQDDDVLPGTSTVRECLLFHCALRGNTTMPLLHRCRRVQRVLQELKLEACADSLIGGNRHKSLSGGERRRVSVACELLGEKSQLLVLDEPTTGLDSTSASVMVDCLNDLVKRDHRTVILSIHQPSSALFSKFTWLIVLSQNGRSMYCGSLVDLENTVPPPFGPIPLHCNIAEHLIEQASTLLPDFVFPSPPVSVVHLDLTPALLVVGHHRPTWKRQVFELMTRSSKNAFRHPFLAITNVFATILIALCCGILYRGVTNDLPGALNRAGFFFFFLCFLMLASIGDLGVFQEERNMVMREKAIGAYSSSAYLFSKVFGEILPLRLVPLAIASFVCTFMIGLNGSPHAVFFLFLLFLLISVVSTLQFLCIGMVFTTNGASNFVCILVAQFNLLMSGFLLQFNGTGGGNAQITSGFEFLEIFSVLHFGFEALMVNELHALNFEIVIRSPDGSEISRTGATGDLILTQLGYSYEHFTNDVTVVVWFAIIFFLLDWFLLSVLVVERR